MTLPSHDIGWLDALRSHKPTQVFKIPMHNDGRPYVITEGVRPDPYLRMGIPEEKKEEESFESIMTLLLGG